MNLKSVALLLAILVCVVFMLVNWAGIITDVPVNLLYTQIQAPLGLILLVMLGLLVTFSLLYSFWKQAEMAIELHKAHKELDNARHLAESAERSRFLELKTQVEFFEKELRSTLESQQNQINTTIKELDEKISTNLAQNVNSISTSLGNIEHATEKLLSNKKQTSNLPVETQPEKKK